MHNLVTHIDKLCTIGENDNDKADWQ